MVLQEVLRVMPLGIHAFGLSVQDACRLLTVSKDVAAAVELDGIWTAILRALEMDFPHVEPPTEEESERMRALLAQRLEREREAALAEEDEDEDEDEDGRQVRRWPGADRMAEERRRRAMAAAAGAAAGTAAAEEEAPPPRDAAGEEDAPPPRDDGNGDEQSLLGRLRDVVTTVANRAFGSLARTATGERQQPSEGAARRQQQQAAGTGGGGGEAAGQEEDDTAAADYQSRVRIVRSEHGMIVVVHRVGGLPAGEEEDDEAGARPLGGGGGNDAEAGDLAAQDEPMVAMVDEMVQAVMDEMVPAVQAAMHLPDAAWRVAVPDARDDAEAWAAMSTRRKVASLVAYGKQATALLKKTVADVDWTWWRIEFFDDAAADELAFEVDLLARLFRSRYSLLIKLAYHHIAADGFRRDEYVDNEGPSYIVDDALNKMAIFGSRTDWFQGPSFREWINSIVFAENLGYYVYSDEDDGWTKSDDRWDSAAGDDEHIESLNVSTSHITPGLVGERLVKTLRLLPLADLDEVHDGDFWQDAHPYRLPSDLIECMHRAGMNWVDVHEHAEDGELHPDFPPFELLDEEYESYDDDDEEGDDDDDEEGDDDDEEGDDDDE